MITILCVPGAETSGNYRVILSSWALQKERSDYREILTQWGKIEAEEGCELTPAEYDELKSWADRHNREARDSSGQKVLL